MWSYALSFAVFAVTFGLMDLVWLSTTYRVVYQAELGPILADKVRIAPAALFYLAYVAGVTFFVLAPALATGDWRQAALRGAAFGLVAYATYDLTNQATLGAWSTRVTVVDLCWGVFATAVAAGVSLAVSAKAARALGLGLPG